MKFNLLFALAALFTIPFSAAAQEVSNKEIAAKIDALSNKVDTILSKLEENNSGSKNEDAARASINEIQSLIASNQFDTAKIKIADFLKKFSGTQYAGAVERMKNEVDVIGKAIPTNWNIEKWYHLEKEADLNSDKPTFIVFWEVWCPHCRREIPKLVELKNTFGPKGVQFVGLTKLSRGTQESELNSFIEENKVNYPIAKEKGDTSTYFAVTGVPAAVFIKNKKVVWRGHPALATAENIQKWMN